MKITTPKPHPLHDFPASEVNSSNFWREWPTLSAQSRRSAYHSAPFHRSTVPAATISVSNAEFQTNSWISNFARFGWKNWRQKSTSRNQSQHLQGFPSSDFQRAPKGKASSSSSLRFVFVFFLTVFTFCARVCACAYALQFQLKGKNKVHKNIKQLSLKWNHKWIKTTTQRQKR